MSESESARGRPGTAYRRRRTRRLIISLSLAGLFFAFLAGGNQHFIRLEAERYAAAQRLAPDQIRLSIEQTSDPTADSAGKFLIQAELPEDAGTVEAGLAVTAQVVAPGGRAIFASTGLTDTLGRLLLALPANLNVPPGAELQVGIECEIPKGSGAVRAAGSLRLVPTRFLTHLALDKTLYRPGDVIRYRSLTLERFRLTADNVFPVHFEIRDPAGSVVPGSQQEGFTSSGVGNGSFAIPNGAPGGEYQLVAHSPDDSFPDEIRKFHIQNYRVPRLRKELEFQKDSYGPGDQVEADFTVRFAEGGPAAGAGLTVKAVIDERQVFLHNAQADESGSAHLEFAIPEDIEIGDGRLSVIVDDGATHETLTKTIPIQLDKIEVTFYPSGGDIVPGLQNTVYFVARNPQGDPVHIAGDIVDSRSRKLAEAETLRDGMGRFEFTPPVGESYRLILTKPTGLRANFDLPAPNAQQIVTIDSGSGVFAAGESPELVVSSTREMPSLLVTAYCRGALLGQQSLSAQSGGNPVKLSLPAETGGVVRVTVHDSSVQPPRPLAERLIFRRSNRQLNVEVTGVETPRAPGERARLQLQVKNEHGEPVAAALGVAVVDDSVLVLADDQYPQLQTHFLVTSEVASPEDLEDAEFYLSDDPEAPAALDLLLGTQGWRRFVEKRLVDLQADPALRDEVARLQALGGIRTPRQEFSNAQSLRKNPLFVADVRVMRGVFRSACVILGIGVILNLIWTLISNPFGEYATEGRSGRGPGGPSQTVLPLLLLSGVLGAAGLIGCGQDAGPAATSAPATADRASDEMSKHGFMMDAGAADDASSAAAAPADFAMPMSEPEPASLIAQSEILAQGMNGPAQPAASTAGIAPPVLAGDAPAADNIEEIDAEGFRFRQQSKNDGEDTNGLIRLFEIDFQRLRNQMMTRDELAQKTFVVREYSFRQRQKRGEQRDDFTETLYWNPLLIADADGRATIEFDLSDSITTFRLTALAHSGDGRIGSGKGEVISRRPFYLEPKLPLAVTVGDRIDLPVAVVNGTSRPLPAGIAFTASEQFTLNGAGQRNVSLDADSRAREVFPIEVTGLGMGRISLSGVADSWRDSVTRPLTVVSQGFPVSESVAGKLAAGDSTIELKLPEQWQPNSLSVTWRLFPSRVAEAQQSLEGMLREPGGCFEQTSSSNYPNTMVLRLLSGPDGAALAGSKLDTVRRAKELLARGYARLAGYESQSGGFEWFGADPGHEALTAFGLMQFYDMQPVFDVDPEMLDRTTRWLLSRRNGSGGFHINPRFLHNWGAPEDVLNAYILWALTETHRLDITAQLATELARAADVGADANDPYLLALCAASLANVGRDSAADTLLSRLVERQHADGSLEGATTVTVSGGISKTVETTALAALAWQKRPAFAESASKAIDWLRSNRRGGGDFGSTQATVLALKALLSGNPPTPSGSGNNPVIVVKLPAGDKAESGTELARFDLSKAGASAPSLTIPTNVLEAGSNHFIVTNESGNPISYTIEASYFTDLPRNDNACPLGLTTKLSSSSASAGEVISLVATLENGVDTGQPMSMLSLGIPAGLEPRTAQLDELVEQGLIDFYELKPREVICYWRSLDPLERIELRLDLTAEIPGEYTGPASKTWLYYTAEQKQWAAPLKVAITQ